MREGMFEAVRQAIEASPYLRGRQLRLEVHDHRVVLRGQVSSYFQKQMAQEAVRRVEGVAAIENLLEVHWPEPWAPAHTAVMNSCGLESCV
jgi:osmotically-inducible protein OsmY